MARLPLRYTIRNLKRRRTRTLLTLAGIALVVAAVVFMLAFSRSLAAMFRQTGEPDNCIVLSKKAQNCVLSSIAAKDADLIRSKFQEKASTYLPEGKSAEAPMISPEVYIGITVEVEGGAAVREGHQRALVHGLDPELGLKVNGSVKLTEGRLPKRGRRELLAGSTAATRIGVAPEDLSPGRTLWMLNKQWTVVGRFEAPGTMMDCELWADLNDLQLYLKRWDYSFIKMKLKDQGEMAAVCKRLSTDEQFEVKAFPEQDYFSAYAEGFDYFRRFAQALALILIAGGLLAGMNTMYTAVLGRIREIGALQVIGFSKRSVLFAILSESLLIALAGGVLGCGLGYLANGIPMKIPMAAFRVEVDGTVLLCAMAAALCIGLGGAFVPAYRALKLRMVDAVRYQ